MARNLPLRPKIHRGESALRGEGAPWHKLSTADVLLVREFINDLDISPTDVARVFKIHPGHARDVALGYRWAWLKPTALQRQLAAKRARRMLMAAEQNDGVNPADVARYRRAS